MANDARKRILVIDDASLVRLYYRAALEGAGFEVAEALNGLEALEQVLAEHFDLLIVDVNMPQMDGLSFLRALRGKSLPLSSIPALVTTTETAPHRVAAARAAGANFYVVKPLKQETLVRVRHAALRDSGMNEFLQQFLIESRELVDQAVEDLLALEKTPTDAERFDDAFRAFHTLKGGAGIVDFAAMQEALHCAEDALAASRAAARPVSALDIGNCLMCLDQVVEWLDVIESTGAPPAGCGRTQSARALCERCRRARRHTRRSRCCCGVARTVARRTSRRSSASPSRGSLSSAGR